MSVSRPLRVSGDGDRFSAGPGGLSDGRAAPPARGGWRPGRRPGPAAAGEPRRQVRTRRPGQHVPADVLGTPGRQGGGPRRRRAASRPASRSTASTSKERCPSGPAATMCSVPVPDRRRTSTSRTSPSPASTSRKPGARAGHPGADHLRPLPRRLRPRGGPDRRATRGARASRSASGVSVGGKKFRVVGIVQAPLGAQASDVYVELEQLQKLSDREGRVNAMNVRASDADSVSSVANAIESSLRGLPGDDRQRPRRPRRRLARRRPGPRRQARRLRWS